MAKRLLVLVGMLAMLLAAAVPAVAQQPATDPAEFTGVVSSGPGDGGPPVFYITDEASGQRYFLDNEAPGADYSIYEGKRVAVQGLLRTDPNSGFGFLQPSVIRPLDGPVGKDAAPVGGGGSGGSGDNGASGNNNNGSGNTGSSGSGGSGSSGGSGNGGSSGNSGSINGGSSGGGSGKSNPASGVGSSGSSSSSSGGGAKAGDTKPGDAKTGDAKATKELPKTGGELPALGLVGALLVGGGLLVHKKLAR